MRSKLVSSGILALALGGLHVAHAQNIDAYIDSLKYDPRSILSVRLDGSTEALPGRDPQRESVIICTNTKKGLEKDLNDVTVLTPISGIVYPGALVRANRSLAEGKPEAISLPRAPITFRVDLPGIGAKGTRVIDNPSNSSVQAALDETLEQWNKTAVAQGYTNAARSTLSIQKAYSKEQLALALGFSSKWGDNEITSNLNTKKNSRSSTTVALFKQVFYTVSVDVAARPSQVFAPDVSLDDVKRQISDTEPPGYVKSIDYGRIIMVRMDTNSSETEVDVEGTLRYVTAGGTEIDGDTKNKYQRIADNSKFTILTIGGNAKSATQAIGSDAFKKIFATIKSGATYSRNNPGYPIAYSVSFLRDNRFATMAFSTDYVDTECKEYNNGYVKLQHAGAYVARWSLDWKEKGADGNGVVDRHWESGHQTAGWVETRNLPGDAYNVHIKAEAATGLVWNPWGEAINIVENGPTNKCYRITGTTLSRHWDNACR